VISKEFAENNDAEFVICSGSKQIALQVAKEISSKAIGAKLGITDISDVLEKIIVVRHRIDILVNNARYHFDSKTWSKIRSELQSISEALHGSMRACRTVISNLIGADGRTTQNAIGGEVSSLHRHPIFLPIPKDPYTFANAAIIAMIKHNACVHGRNTTEAFIGLRNIAKEGAYNSMSTNKK
jgi:NAD(P)-dependent dehydrogenase (short-subunit alcohol dehydrogenase family)